MPYPLTLFCVVLVPLILPVPGCAAFETAPLGARPAGMAGAFVALADDANTVFINPAGMSQLTHPELTSYYTVLYGIEELNRIMLAVVLPTRIGGIGLSCHVLGGDLYHETVVGGAYSRSLFPGALAGVTLRTLMLSIDRYGVSRATVLDAGMLVRLPGRLRFGIAMRTLNRTRLAGRQRQMPRTLHTGISRTNPRIVITAQLDWESGQRINVRIGQEFRLTPRLSVRSGVVTDASVVFGGIGVRLPYTEMSYAVSSHPVLGLTHRFSLSVRFGRPTS